MFVSSRIENEKPRFPSLRRNARSVFTACVLTICNAQYTVALLLLHCRQVFWLTRRIVFPFFPPSRFLSGWSTSRKNTRLQRRYRTGFAPVSLLPAVVL